MDTQKVTAEYRLSQWAQVIEAQLNSGQSIRDFCQTAGISKNKYFYWQKKLRNKACAELEETRIVPSGWMQLEPKHMQSVKEALDIEINGCHITANAETDPELLKKVCRVLRSI